MDEEDPEVWKEVQAAVDPDNRRRELNLTQDIRGAIDRGDDWEEVYEKAEEMDAVPPVAVSEDETDGGPFGDWYSVLDHMFLSQLPYMKIGGAKRVAMRCTELLAADEDGGVTEDLQELVLEQHPYGHTGDLLIDHMQNIDQVTDREPRSLYQKLMERLPAGEKEEGKSVFDVLEEDAEAAIEETLEYSLDLLEDELEDYISKLETDGPVEVIRDAISEEKYGYRGGNSGSDGFEDYYDFPHYVGMYVATVAHHNGFGPQDIVENPEAGYEVCDQAIDQATEDYLEYVQGGDVKSHEPYEQIVEDVLGS